MSKLRMRLPITLVFCLVITCLSCALRSAKLVPTYEGPLKPKNEVATLSVYDYQLLFAVEEIDGKSLADIRSMNEKTKSNYFALLPGEHLVKIGGRPGPSGGTVFIKDQYVIVDGKEFPVTLTRQRVDATHSYTACFGEWTFKIMVEAGHYYFIQMDDDKEIKQLLRSPSSTVSMTIVAPHIQEGYLMGISTDKDHVKPINQKTVSTLVDFKPSTTSSWEKK